MFCVVVFCSFITVLILIFSYNNVICCQKPKQPYYVAICQFQYVKDKPSGDHGEPNKIELNILENCISETLT